MSGTAPGIPHRTRCDAALLRARAARGLCEVHAFDGSCPRSQLRQKSDDDVHARDMPRRGKPKRRIDGHVSRDETRATRTSGHRAHGPQGRCGEAHPPRAGLARGLGRAKSPTGVTSHRETACTFQAAFIGSSARGPGNWGNRPPRSTQEDRGRPVPSSGDLRKESPAGELVRWKALRIDARPFAFTRMRGGGDLGPTTTTPPGKSSGGGASSVGRRSVRRVGLARHASGTIRPNVRRGGHATAVIVIEDRPGPEAHRGAVKHTMHPSSPARRRGGIVSCREARGVRVVVRSLGARLDGCRW